MITIKAVNKAIAASGIKAELVRANGYFYFDGDDVAFAYSASVMVSRLNDLSLEQWLIELREKLDDHNSRKPCFE